MQKSYEKHRIYLIGPLFIEKKTYTRLKYAVKSWYKPQLDVQLKTALILAKCKPREFNVYLRKILAIIYPIGFTLMFITPWILGKFQIFLWYLLYSSGNEDLK